MNTSANTAPFPRTIVGPFPEPPEDDDEPAKGRVIEDDSQYMVFEQPDATQTAGKAVAGLRVVTDHDREEAGGRLEKQFAEKEAVAAEKRGRLMDVLVPAVGIAVAGTVTFLYLNHKLPGINVVPPSTPQHTSAMSTYQK